MYQFLSNYVFVNISFNLRTQIFCNVTHSVTYTLTAVFRTFTVTLFLPYRVTTPPQKPQCQKTHKIAYIGTADFEN